MALSLGDMIDGKYRIVRLIGEGGMGTVYEAENVLIRRRVAVKVLQVTQSTSQDIVRRFEREAQAAGEIGSDHIMEVLDLGTLPTGERYMVMEYLDGETLSQRIARFGKLSAEQIAGIAGQFLEGLAAAHAAGIIHRDLKPDNIFITKSKAGRIDFVKIIDFGISKFNRTNEPLNLTRVGAMMGTPCYMSPEQARGLSEADVRSDIYAVGVILYEAVTGRLPFEAENFNDLMFKIALSDAKPPSELVPGLDPTFEAIIAQAMAREPAHRFQSVTALSNALTPWTERSSMVALNPSSSALRAVTTHAKYTDSVGSSPNAVASGRLPEHRATSGTGKTWAQTQLASAEDEALPVKSRRKVVGIASAVTGIAVVAVLGLVMLRSPAAKPRTDVAPAVSPPPTAPTAENIPPVDPVVPTSEALAADASAPPVTATAKTTTPSRPTSRPKPSSGQKGPKAPDFGY